MPRTVLLLFLWLITASIFADGPADNLADQVRPIPPPGIEIPADIRTRLENELKPLEEKIARIASMHSEGERGLPDVEIFAKAVRSALTWNEFYHTNEFAF